MGNHPDILNSDVMRFKKERAEIIGPHRETANDYGNMAAFVSISYLGPFTSLSKRGTFYTGLDQYLLPAQLEDPEVLAWISPTSFSKHFYFKRHFSD